ncbi:porin family protein [Pontibacter fetidus]|uniref:PorT family protein n=1 Tax=Pontibacter fetidus TaxID=2700082 RepID=A0A6B2H2A1_9BACT|nr:outer membrane beta-barrel protein [Pontibacter fetidus]NDK56453.1 PorT family protein [Pontibacter fetidus]
MKANLFLFFLSTILLFNLQPATAQSDFRDGFVVLSAGDTLKGQVNYRSGILAGNVCVFKPAGQAKEVSYTPKDIAGYGFPNDKNFLVRHLDHADTLAAEDVFVEELVRGNIGLYNYKGTFFVEKNSDTKLHKLYITHQSYYKYGVNENPANSTGTLAVRQINHHVMVLNMLMQDCFRMLSKIERVTLTQKSLVALVREYNQCTGSEDLTVFKESKPWLAARAGIVAGFNHTSLNFSAKDEAYLHLEHADFNKETYPSFGLMVRFNSPRVSEQLALQLEAQYVGYKYTAQPSYEWFDTYYDNDIAFNLSAVKGSALLRYDFGGKAIQPFVNLGSFINFYQTRDYKHRQYVRRTSTGTPEERIKDNPDFVAKRQKGLLAGAGTYINIKNKKLSVEARYEYGADLHEHSAANRMNKVLDSNTQTIALLLGLYF